MINKIIKAIEVAYFKRVGNGNDSMMQGQLNGRFYVIYPDRKKSVRMFYHQACSYRDIFGGEVMYGGKNTRKKFLSHE